MTFGRLIRSAIHLAGIEITRVLGSEVAEDGLRLLL
jgi:hypothetical protein